MKIAILTPVFPPYKGGIGQVARQEAEELAKRGHQVTVLAPLYKESDLEFDKQEYKIIRLKPTFKFGNAAWIRHLDLIGFDVVHLHYPFIGVVDAINKQPLVVTYHMDLIGRGWKKYFFKVYTALTLPKIIKLADKIIISSLDYAQHGRLAPYLVQKLPKFVEAPFGVQCHSRAGGNPVASIVDPRIREDDNDKTVLFVGGLDKAHYFKGVDVLLKAFKQLDIENKKLKIVGEGDLRPYYENLVRELGLEKQVEFLGKLNQDELNKVYTTADVFVLPSIDASEAYGLVILEAMSNGLPVVVSDLPGVRTNIGADRGRLVQPGDDSSLMQMLKEILSDEMLRKKMGESAKAWVSVNRTLSGEIDKIEKVLVDAVSNRL